MHPEAFYLPASSPSSVRSTEFGSGWDVIAPWPADSLFNRTGSSSRGVSRFVPQLIALNGAPLCALSA